MADEPLTVKQIAERYTDPRQAQEWIEAYASQRCREFQDARITELETENADILSHAASVEESFNCLKVVNEDLQAEIEQLKRGKPIVHEGVEYWPDANGWYSMKCLPMNQWVLAIVDGICQLDNEPYIPIICIFTENVGWQDVDSLASDSHNCIDIDPDGWQPLPAGIVRKL